MAELPVGTLRPKSLLRLSRALKPEPWSVSGKQRESWGDASVTARCGGREELSKGTVPKRWRVGGCENRLGVKEGKTNRGAHRELKICKKKQGKDREPVKSWTIWPSDEMNGQRGEK